MTKDVCLRKWLRHNKRRRFARGTFDCVMAALDFVRYCTGKDPAEGWRGTYKTGKGAQEILEKNFSGSLLLAMCSVLGDAQPLGSNPSRGDIGVVFFAGREVAGVRDKGCWWVPSTHGLVPIFDRDCGTIKFWRIDQCQI